MRIVSRAVLVLAVCGFSASSAAGQTQAAAGRVVFERWCSACHAPVSGDERLAGTSVLALRYKGERPAALEERTDLTVDLVRFYVRNGMKAMPFFRKTEVSDPDLDALANYLTRNNK